MVFAVPLGTKQGLPGGAPRCAGCIGSERPSLLGRRSGLMKHRADTESG